MIAARPLPSGANDAARAEKKASSTNIYSSLMHLQLESKRSASTSHTCSTQPYRPTARYFETLSALTNCTAQLLNAGPYSDPFFFVSYADAYASIPRSFVVMKNHDSLAQLLDAAFEIMSQYLDHVVFVWLVSGGQAVERKIAW